MRPATANFLLLFAAIPAMGQQWTMVVLHPVGARESRILDIDLPRQAGYCEVEPTGNAQGGIWSGSAASWAPVTNSQFQGYILGIDDATVVGVFQSHAMMWIGQPPNATDLHPAPSAGAITSGAVKAKGALQAGGIGLLFDGAHACYWQGTSESFVDLHPLGAVRSNAEATDGNLIGGYVRFTNADHAVIWTRDPVSVVDLHPSGAVLSRVRGMVPGVQVGEARIDGESHAALWRGSAASFVDLGPPEPNTTWFAATTGRVHAGLMGQNGLGRAAVNFGTRHSWVGLHQFLPSSYVSFSEATCVYQEGPTVYVGGWAEHTPSTWKHAILWIGTDPCYANCDQSTASPVLNVLDFNCFLNKFAVGDPYANCDTSTMEPTLNVLDFNCFLNKFAAGCP